MSGNDPKKSFESMSLGMSKDAFMSFMTRPMLMDQLGVGAEIRSTAQAKLKKEMEEFEARIASEHYFSAEHGIAGDGSISKGNEQFTSKTSTALANLSFCILVLRDGSTVTGEVTAEPNEDEEAIYKRARQKAIDKMRGICDCDCDE